jgi:EpsI family protein
MLGSDRKYLLVVVILAAAAACVLGIHQARSSISPKIDLAKIPLEVSGWQAEELEVTDDIYNSLETKDIIIRRYDKGDLSLYFVMVYSGEKRHSFHPPELCYLGGDEVKLRDKTKELIVLDENKNLMTNKLVMTSGPQTTKAWYWFAAGKRFTDSYYFQQFYLMSDAFRGQGLNGALIRISALGSSQVVEDQAKTFIRAMAPHLEEFFKNL